jgi:protein arginine kinase activator
MKKCLRCNKQANLHITEVKQGKAQSLHLCETCAQEYLNVVEVGGAMEDFAPDGVPAEAEDDPSIPESTKSCPYCGITYKQFRSQGRLGCPHDYEVFREQLIPLLESIHGQDIQHVGKCPPRTSESNRRHYELLRLRGELKAAVEAEAYEKAAELRDRIQKLETTAATD